MRDLKTLLELLLSEWEANKGDGNINKLSGFCSASFRLNRCELITDEEECLIDEFIDEFIEEDRLYLFEAGLHNERVEWLKERIKELEK